MWCPVQFAYYRNYLNKKLKGSPFGAIKERWEAKMSHINNFVIEASCSLTCLQRLNLSKEEVNCKILSCKKLWANIFIRTSINNCKFLNTSILSEGPRCFHIGEQQITVQKGHSWIHLQGFLFCFSYGQVEIIMRDTNPDL